ncbi:RND superfamily putative drug exporter [Paenibacillus castaneae]|uniref:MMPL family transporter n=1 Tax=Paenibacillus castaneae TaxID=474957 RepID=UPI000C9BAD7A|nr:efflux RND transporter permease subunit [Paenibacillus castaneae]NIK78949.1 RND superfamily putative drug exporter [Paenibacillus castaneae]
MGLDKLALVSFRFPKPILVSWSIIILVMGSYALRLDTVLKDHGLYPNGQYAKVQEILASDFGIPDDPTMLLFEKEDTVTKAVFYQFIEQTLQRTQKLNGLDRVISPLKEAGLMRGNFAYALLSFSSPSYRMEKSLESLEESLPQHPHISVKMTGKSVVQRDVNRASHFDLAQAELIGIPLAFFVLWLVFRRLVIAMLPILIGVASVAIAMGLMFGMGLRMNMSNFVLNVIPMVGLALSIDFALMIVSRFREELQSRGAAEALTAAMRTAGRAVLYSSASIFLGLLSFVWIPLPMFSSIAYGAMTVLTVSMLLSFTLLPALLAVFLPALYKGRERTNAYFKQSFWHMISRFVMKKPALLGGIAASMLLGCLLPLRGIALAIPDATSLPLSYSSRLAADAYQKHFETPSTSRIWLVAEDKALFRDKADWLKAYALVEQLTSDRSVKEVDSVFSRSGMTPEQLYRIVQKPSSYKKYVAVLQPFVSGDHMLIGVTLAGEPSSKEARQWLRIWEQKQEPGGGRGAAASSLPFLLGGEAKYQQEVFDNIFANIGYVIAFLFISNFIVLFIAFRSVVVALKTIVMNLLSLGASFGILAWIFESGRLGMEPSSIAIMIPVFIFGLVFGISMDYGVFLLSRIYEEYRRTQNNEYAVLTGMASTSKIITSAAAIMIAVTAPFAFGEVVGVKQLGIGIATAIFIDATVVRMVLVPSLMSLLGKWNWWAPRWF